MSRYRSLLDLWMLFDNSETVPRFIAREEVGEFRVFDSVKAEKALKEAVTDTIRDHARTGDPLAIWRNGKVVWIPAKRLLQQQSRSRKK